MRVIRIEDQGLVQIPQRLIEILLAYVEIPALPIGNGVPGIQTDRLVNLADLRSRSASRSLFCGDTSCPLADRAIDGIIRPEILSTFFLTRRIFWTGGIGRLLYRTSPI